MTAKRPCPFGDCEGTMVPQQGENAPVLLLNILIAETSPIHSMMGGAANRSINGQIKVCDECGYITLFA